MQTGKCPLTANSRTDFVPYRTLPHRIWVKNGLCHKTAFVPPDFVPYRISSLPDFVPPDFVPNRTSSDRPLSYAGLWVAGKCRAGHCRSPAIVGSESVAPAFGQRPLTFYLCKVKKKKRARQPLIRLSLEGCTRWLSHSVFFASIVAFK